MVYSLKNSEEIRGILNEYLTNIPYIFAGGDVVNGADLVVTAIADGKRAATWVHQYLLSLGVKDSVD